MIRVLTKFNLENFNFITGVTKAYASHYLYEETATKTDDLSLRYLTKPFDEYTVTGYHTTITANNYGFATPPLVTEVTLNANDINRWFDWNIPTVDMAKFLNGTKTNDGYMLHGKLHMVIHEKVFRSKEYSEIEKRPKLTIIYDMPDYIKVFEPVENKKIRPTEENQIVWYSNINSSYKIELLKNGSVVDLIADNITNSPYTWKFSQHQYTSGTDYSIRISASGTSSSNEPIFEIINFEPILTVKKGEGSGQYSKNETVNINGTNNDTYLYEFIEWIGDIQYLANSKSEFTTVTMPDQDVEISAIYERAYMKIPGIVQVESYHSSLGKWQSNWVDFNTKDNEYIHISVHPDSCYLDYGLSIQKSGSYKVSSTYKMFTAECDSITIYMQNINNTNMIKLGEIENGESSNYITTNMDTIFLPKENEMYQVTFDPYPLEVENGWDILNRFFFDKLEFELVEEGDVLTVINGDGDGLFNSGDAVSISAVTPKTGGTFSYWSSESGLVIANPSQKKTTVTMGSGNCIVKAIYEGGSIGNIADKIVVNNSLNIIKTNNSLIVKLSEADTGNNLIKVNIFDLQGRKIKVVKSNSQITNISLKNIPAGVYLYQIKANTLKLSEKFVITK